MMRSNLAIIFFLMISSSFAQDCSGLKEYEEYRLDKNGGPLTNTRVQDQDGLGICFANSGSVALLSALPGNPNVSYLHMALSLGQMKKDLTNNTKDSAFSYNDSGVKLRPLLESGDVCATIQAAKSDKIGGVCLRADVPLEKSLFDPKTNSSEDALLFQQKVISAVSEFYDSIKEKFGINPSTSKEEIAKRTLAFTNYKYALARVIKENQKNFTRESCLKPDLTNAKNVYKNLIVKQFTYFKNKYGENNFSNSFERVNGKPNPDLNTYLYFIRMGTVSRQSTNELKVNVDEKISNTLLKNYIGDLTSESPSKDAVTSFRNALMKDEDPKYAERTEQILSSLSPADIELLQKDYNRYVKKDVSDCIRSNPMEYYKSADGFIKDYSSDTCLKNYLPQGKNLQSLLDILDKANLNNFKALNSFLNKLPTATYEESMRAILAPDCRVDQKIRIPGNLKCKHNNLSYSHELTLKVLADKKISLNELENKIKLEENNELSEIDAAYPERIAALKSQYAGKTDAASLEKIKNELKNLEIDKNNRKLRAGNLARIKILKELLGHKEQTIWNEFVSSNKKQFNFDAINLIKNQKQAMPLTLCTRLFSFPGSITSRDGVCGKDYNDSRYQAVAGTHSVTVVGVRCKKGKLDYLIQNSWGDWDSITNAKNSDGTQHFEHEYGKAWMNENELINNTFDYQKITK